METRFLAANEGMPRRFPNIVHLENYSNKELSMITMQFLTNNCPDIKLEKMDINLIYNCISFMSDRIPEALENQAGACENLASSISRSIYGSPEKTFAKNSKELIINGFN